MKYLFFIGVALCLAGFLWTLYKYFFIYFDVLLTPKEKLFIYWPQSVIVLIGYIIITVTKDKS